MTDTVENEVKRPHIFIAMPCYGGMMSGHTAQSLMTLGKVLNQCGMDVSYSFMFNESLITRARNALVQNFLKSEATHLMFIDADIKFFPEEVPAMVDASKDIICGIYPKKEINWDSVKAAMDRGVPNDQLKYHTGSFVVNLVGYSGEVTVPANEPVEIWNGGTGFMLIKREVFGNLKDHVPTYTNDVLDLSGNIKNDKIHEYFATSIEDGTNRLLSEDYHFCMIARKQGMKVYAAPWVHLAHMGSYLFEGRLLENAE